MKKIFIVFLALILATSIAAALPSVGDTGVDYTHSDNGYNWYVCRADDASAWISADTLGTYSAINVCTELGYTGVDAWGGTCGDVCGYCGDSIEYYDFGGGGPEELAFTVNWRCTGYEGEVPPNGDVPEFGLIAGAIAVLGAAAIVVSRRK